MAPSSAEPFPSSAARQAALEARIAELRKERKRRHRRANLIFLLTGLSFGTLVYLARTRSGLFAGGSPLVYFLAGLGVAICLFVLGGRLHNAAMAVDEDISDLRDQLLSLRR